MRRLRLLTAGESHGPAATALLEGLPAGLTIDREAVDARLRRRQHGFGRGGRQRIEKDCIEGTQARNAPRYVCARIETASFLVVRWSRWFRAFRLGSRRIRTAYQSEKR